ncbi:hypothetical protein [Mucilaginibacter galii]|nr:hypothetical protein [Mucilaginibacter galii]
MKWWPGAKSYTFKCPDGTTRTIYKDINEAFPLAIRDAKSKIDSDIKAEKLAAAKISVDYQTKVSNILYRLSDENESLMLNFRTTYLAFISDPCGNGSFLKRQIETTIHKQNQLQELRMQINGLTTLAQLCGNDLTTVMPIYIKIIGKISGFDDATIAQIEIKNNTQNAHSWIDGGQNG